jgi:hypothetical protein
VDELTASLESVRTCLDSFEEERARQQVADLQRRIREKGAAVVAEELEHESSAKAEAAQASGTQQGPMPQAALDGVTTKPKRTRRLSVSLRRASLTPLVPEVAEMNGAVAADAEAGSANVTDVQQAALHGAAADGGTAAATAKPRRARRKSVRLRRASLTSVLPGAAMNRAADAEEVRARLVTRSFNL